MKTFDKKDVYSWSNAEKAKQYIGKQGYFGDSIAELDNQIQGVFKNILTDIFASDTDRASFPFGNDDEETWSLFLPADKVKEVEEPKKWRAFKDYQEFTTWTKKSVGDVIYIRTRNNKEENYISVIISFISLTKIIIIGKDNFSLFQLFNDYEWLDEQGEWKTFGVLDES